MENKLQEFLDEAFKPYGNFPSRKDVEQELLANLTEKYQDLKLHAPDSVAQAPLSHYPGIL